MGTLRDSVPKSLHAVDLTGTTEMIQSPRFGLSQEKVVYECPLDKGTNFAANVYYGTPLQTAN